MTVIRFVIHGEAASKANSRKVVTIADRPALIKSGKALGFERSGLLQIPPAARVRLAGPVAVNLRILYTTERPDLDESLVLDMLQDRWGKRDLITKERPLLQAGVYRNDRQVREKHVYWGLDRKNPRVLVEVWPIQQTLTAAA